MAADARMHGHEFVQCVLVGEEILGIISLLHLYLLGLELSCSLLSVMLQAVCKLQS